MLSQTLLLPSTDIIKMKLSLNGQAYTFENVAEVRVWLKSDAEQKEYTSNGADSNVRFFDDGRIWLTLGAESIPPGTYDVYIKAYGEADERGQTLAHPALKRARAIIEVESFSL